MADLTREQLIELVTKEVVSAVTKKEEAEQRNEKSSVALVIGCTDKLPDSVKQKHRCVSIEKYNGDISTIDELWITELETSELADIALGRNIGSAPSAVIDGLMNGKAIYLSDSALEHRSQKAKCSRGFYDLLEKYVASLQSFGIKLVQKDSTAQELKVSVNHTPKALVKGVVTEIIAKDLVKTCNTEVLLNKGTIITPSARDVFLHAHCNVRYV